MGAYSPVNTNEQRLRVRVEGDTTLVSQTISMLAPGNGTQYHPEVFDFVADSSTTTLFFEDQSLTSDNVDIVLDNVRVTLQSGPVITSQPQSMYAALGGTATFSVTATGQAPLSYQWRFNGSNIAGATFSTYTRTNVQAAHAGSYDVVVSDPGGSITSDTATLTVGSPGGLVNGSFESNLTGWTSSGNLGVVSGFPFTVTAGVNAVDFNGGQATPNGVLAQTFSTVVGQGYVLAFDAGALSFVNQDQMRLQVTVTGSGTLVSQTIQIQAPGNGTQYLPQSFGFVANTTTTTVTFRDVSLTTENTDLMLDNVRVTVQNGPVITAQPQSVTVAQGGTANFSVTATGQAPLSYQWRFNGSNLAGATSSTFSRTNVQASHAGLYDVVVSNPGGPVTSDTATLTVIAPGGLVNGSFESSLTGWTSSGNLGVVSGFPFTATAGVNAVDFNGGQATPNGVLAQTFSTVVGQGYVLAFDAGALSFVNQDQMRLQMTVTGSGTLVSQTIQIQAPGNGTQYLPQSFGFVANTTTTTVTFRDVSLTTENTDLMLDNVRVTVQNGPVITAQPQSVTVAPGGTANFSVTATGQAPLSYQWRFNGSNLAGATSSTFSRTNVQVSHAGLYDVVVTNPGGSVTSNTATLTVATIGDVTNGSFESNYAGWTATGDQLIATSDPGHPASHGTKAVVFNPDSIGAPSHDGVLSQTFATTPGQRYGLAFDLGTVGAITDQRVRVRLQGSGILLDQIIAVAPVQVTPTYFPQHWSFVANSASTTLTIEDVSFTPLIIDMLLDNVRVTPQNAQAPFITSQPLRTAVAQGASATFSVVASGTNLTYQWQFQGSNIAGATGSSYTVTNAQTANAGNYSVIISNASGTVSSSAATLTVLPAAILLNGSFEFGTAAWTFSALNTAPTLNPIYTKSDGIQLIHFNYGQLAPVGTVSQAFATTVGQTYTVAFDVGAFGYTQDEMRVRVRVEGNTTLVSQLISVFGPGNGTTTYLARSVTFVANSPTTVLAFDDDSTATLNIDLVLDNVRVTTSNAPAITAQPRSLTAPVGANVTFSVTATGQGCRISGGSMARTSPARLPRRLPAPTCKTRMLATTTSWCRMAPGR